MGEEHRRFARRRALKCGRIVFNPGHSTINCTSRDLSAFGARLEVANSVCINDEFALAFDDGGPLRRCLVRRISGTSVGFEFCEIS